MAFSKFYKIMTYVRVAVLAYFLTENLKSHGEKMSVRVNVRMSKIKRIAVIVSIRTYATYANCRTLIACAQPHTRLVFMLLVVCNIAK